MEKENIIDNTKDARLLKELINDIVHEYAVNDLHIIFREVMDQSPLLLQYARQALLKVEELNQKLKD